MRVSGRRIHSWNFERRFLRTPIDSLTVNIQLHVLHSIVRRLAETGHRDGTNASGNGRHCERLCVGGCKCGGLVRKCGFSTDVWGSLKKLKSRIWHSWVFKGFRQAILKSKSKTQLGPQSATASGRAGSLASPMIIGR